MANQKLKMGKADRLKTGKLKFTSISTGFFWGDAGIVFGNLPKTIYDKISYPNKENKIKLYLNSLLIEYRDKKVLIDPGLGALSKYLKLDSESIHILNPLKKLGFKREDITHIIITHLHADHCGGLLLEKEGNLELTFPKAEILIQQKEWDVALNPDGLNKVYYMIKPLIKILKTSNNLVLIEGEYSLDENITLIPSGGHCEGLQIVKINDNEKVLIFASDLIPTRKHRNLSVFSSQDLSRKDSFSYRKRLFKQLSDIDEIFYYHDKKPGDTF